MSAAWHHLQELGDGPLALTFVGTGLCLIGLSVVRCFLLFLHLIQKFEGRKSHWLSQVGAGLMVANTLAFVSFQSSTRAAHREVVFGPSKLDPSQEARLMAEAIAAEISGEGFWALSMLVGGAVYGLARLCHRKARPVRQCTWVALGLVGVVTFASLQHVDALLYRGMHPSGSVDPHYKERVLLEMLQDSIVPMDAAIWIVASVCSLACVIGLRWAATRVASSRGELRIALGVFLCGVVSFIMTRAHHVDAREIIPPRLAPPYQCESLSVDGLPALRGSAQPKFAEGPIVLIDTPSRSLIDGIPAGLAQTQEILQNKRELWSQIWPDRPFAGNVVFSIPGNLTMDDVAPWLQQARAAGFPHLHALVRAPRESFDSRTLGTIERAPTCRTVELKAEWGPLETWGGYVERAAE